MITNYIFQCENNYASISNKVEAKTHKHWMLQLFLSSEKELDIRVNKEEISCKMVLVDMNTNHTFRTKGVTHFTVLIHPISKLGRSLKMKYLKNRPYYIFSLDEIGTLQKEFKKVLLQENRSELVQFVKKIIDWNMDEDVVMDERVRAVLQQLDHCHHENDGHQIKHLAQQMCLSESRLAHLFKAETGIPLKSYIVLHKLNAAYNAIFNGESITTAAIKSGFDSSAHLAYTNKKMTGMSASNITKDSVFLKVF